MGKLHYSCLRWIALLWLCQPSTFTCPTAFPRYVMTMVGQLRNAVDGALHDNPQCEGTLPISGIQYTRDEMNGYNQHLMLENGIKILEGLKDETCFNYNQKIIELAGMLQNEYKNMKYELLRRRSLLTSIETIENETTEVETTVNVCVRNIYRYALWIVTRPCDWSGLRQEMKDNISRC